MGRQCLVQRGLRGTDRGVVAGRLVERGLRGCDVRVGGGLVRLCLVQRGVGVPCGLLGFVQTALRGLGLGVGRRPVGLGLVQHGGGGVERAVRLVQTGLRVADLRQTALRLLDGGLRLRERAVRRGLVRVRLVQPCLRGRQRGLRGIGLVQLRVGRGLRGLGLGHGLLRVGDILRGGVERGLRLRGGRVGRVLRSPGVGQRGLGLVQRGLRVRNALACRGDLGRVRVVRGLRGRQRVPGVGQRGLRLVVGVPCVGHGVASLVGLRLGRVVRRPLLVAGGHGLLEGLLEGRRVGRVRGDPFVELTDVVVHVVRRLAGGLRILAELLRVGDSAAVVSEAGVLESRVYDVEVVADLVEQLGVGAGHLIGGHAGEVRIVVRVLQCLLVEGLLPVVPAVVGVVESLLIAPCQILGIGALTVVVEHEVRRIGLPDGQRHQAVGDAQRLEPLGGAQLVALLDTLQRGLHVLQGDGVIRIVRVNLCDIFAERLVGQDAVGVRVAALKEIDRGLRLLRLRLVQRGLRVRDRLVGGVQRALRVRLGRAGLDGRVPRLVERDLAILYFRLCGGDGGLRLVQSLRVGRLRVLGGH